MVQYRPREQLTVDSIRQSGLVPADNNVETQDQFGHRALGPNIGFDIAVFTWISSSLPIGGDGESAGRR